MAQADGYVLPKPGIPKTLGILSVIFAVILLLLGLCSFTFMAAAPALVGVVEKTQKEIQAKAEAQKQAQAQAYEEREKAASTDEEKEAIRKERDAAIASSPPVPVMDMADATAQLRDPTVKAITFFGLGTGILLHLMLLVGGIGMIRLTSWGRSWSLAWAAIQIPQILLLAALNVMYVMPVTVAQNEKNLAKMEAAAGPGAAEAAKFSRAMSGPAVLYGSQILSLIAGCTYPVIVLILMNRPAAKAACMGPKPSGPADF